MEDKESKSIIEAMLFMSGETVSLDTLRKIIEVDKYNTERLVWELINEYALRNKGLMILEVAEGYQMVTNPACAPWIKKLLSTVVPKKLTQSSLETMAIIAYKQPIIKSEIEAIRGVNSDGVVKTLLERRLVKILGRKEVPGRPLMYGTTNEFLQYFGLKDLSELPTLKEFAEVDVPEPPENAVDGMESLEAMKGEGRAIEDTLEQEEAVVHEKNVQSDDQPQEDSTESGDIQDDIQVESAEVSVEPDEADVHEENIQTDDQQQEDLLESVDIQDDMQEESAEVVVEPQDIEVEEVGTPDDQDRPSE